MTEVFEFILIITALVIGLGLITFLTRRAWLIIRLFRIRKIDGASIKLTSPLSLLSRGVSRRPLISVTLGGAVYDVHLFNGGGRSRVVHIASPKFAVVFTRLGGITPRRVSKTLTARPRAVVVMPSGVAGAKTRIIPTPARKNGHIPVLLFSPEPSELTYVTKERTSIKVAFTGEQVGSWLIFTKDTLIRHLDRRSRGFFDGVKIYEEE